MDKEEFFYKKIASDILKKNFGILVPTQEQIEEMKAILFYTWLKRTIIFDEKLTDREKEYLYFASRGKTYIEIANLLERSSNTVRDYEKEILRKLKCKNMKQAIALGIKYGDIKI